MPKPVFRLRLHHDDAGTTTVEYALATLTAATFAALFIRVVGSDQVRDLFNAVVTKSLS